MSTGSQRYILYTYQPSGGQEVCHAYDAGTDQGAAQAEGQKLEQQTPTLGFMVLPLEEMPS